MGIPRFAYRMREYARTEVIGEADGSSQKTIAVIDGPSLAHFIFHESRCNGNDRNTIISPCNYAELAKKVIEWLDRLQSYGFEIEAIYFDGALPTCKKKTRTERLQNSVDNLVGFKLIHDDVHKVTRTSRVSVPSTLDTQRLQIARRDLASPPFLVFAVLEALLDSHYAERTWVVPGEADPFCAVAAKSAALFKPDTAVTIFTNDSDLIIYDSGPQTKVVMINSIDERNDKDGRMLRALQFSPRELRQLALEPLPDLIKPVYEMLSPQVSFREALGKSRNDICTREYRDFAESYSLVRPIAELEVLKTSRERKTEVLQTDARISELIHQAKDESHRICESGKDTDHWVRTCGSKSSECVPQCDINQIDPLPTELPPLSDLQMYLPFLFEDPSRGSAWRIGIPFRSAAASLVQKFFNLKIPVLEYKRSGSSLHAIKLKSTLDNDLEQDFLAWTESIYRGLELRRHLDSITSWRLLVVAFTLPDMKHEKVALPVAKDIMQVLASRALTTWPQVHFAAQFQAEYYSLRMLKEVLRFSFSSQPKPSAASTFNSYQTLHEQLENLPPIAQFFDPDSKDDLQDDELRFMQAAVDGMLVRLDPKSMKLPDQTREGVKSQKKRKGTPSGMFSTINSAARGVGDKNPFGTLSEE